jgi:hypothetical protein
VLVVLSCAVQSGDDRANQRGAVAEARDDKPVEEALHRTAESGDASSRGSEPSGHSKPGRRGCPMPAAGRNARMIWTLHPGRRSASALRGSSDAGRRAWLGFARLILGVQELLGDLL